MPGRLVTRARALFGKLPAHGDFVRRGDAALVTRLDRWLTGEVERIARDPDRPYEEVLGALVPWCFVLDDGLAGAFSGSRDRVGRLFPVAALAQGGEATAMVAADLLERATAGAVDADGLFDAADWDGAAIEQGASSAAGQWWPAPGGERVPVAGLATGPAFDRLWAEPA